MEEQNSLIPFEGKPIRKVWHNDEWYFSIVDVIEILADATNPASYWNKVQKTILSDSQLLPFWQKLKLVGKDGRSRPSDCANTEGVLRIAMSVPSPKAEPLKLWLAQVGKERIEETENPELLTERQAEIYRAKGYSEEWIQRRLQSIETRKALTDEWKSRGVTESKDFSILTAEIAKATFDVAPAQHAQIKKLERQNLRDHMTPLELVFSALSEEITRTVTVRDDAQGFLENRDAAIEGGSIAGEARRNAEKRLGQKIVSDTNYLGLISEKNIKNELPADEESGRS